MRDDDLRHAGGRIRAGRAVFIVGGEIVEEARPKQIFAAPQQERSQAFFRPDVSAWPLRRTDAHVSPNP
jgi:ABC-type methionine transport system ATPase subunit